MAITHKYRLDGNANDVIAGANGTESNITYSPGAVNQCANFNGSSSQIYNIPTLSTPFSVSLIVSADVTSGVFRGLFETGYNYALIHFPSAPDVGFGTYCNEGGGYLSYLQSANIVLGRRYHLIVTFNGTTEVGYTDGRQSVNGARYISYYSYFRIGCSMWNDQWHSGTIDEVEIHNAVIPPAHAKNKFAFYKGFI